MGNASLIFLIDSLSPEGLFIFIFPYSGPVTLEAVGLSCSKFYSQEVGYFSLWWKSNGSSHFFLIPGGLTPFWFLNLFNFRWNCSWVGSHYLPQWSLPGTLVITDGKVLMKTSGREDTCCPAKREEVHRHHILTVYMNVHAHKIGLTERIWEKKRIILICVIIISQVFCFSI